MTSPNDRYDLTKAWLLVFGCTVLRLWYATLFPLVPDETNYWQWSRYLSLGYYDQAPLIAWAIKLATCLLGHTEMGVRLPSVLALGVASIYLVLTAYRWIGPSAALKIALLSQGILEFNVGGLLATPDGLQAAAWAAACYHVARAYEDHGWVQWLLGGFWFGLGMLSKFTMIIFLPGAYLYGLFFAAHRPRLASLRPYIGVLIGFLMFCPVIWWNARHDWSSVRHVAYLGGANEAFTLHFKYLGDFLASQAALLSPLAFLLVLRAWPLALKSGFRTQNWIYPYLFFTSFPMFAGFALLSLHTRVYGNWPGAGYLTASLLVIAFFAGRPSEPSHPDVPRWGQRLLPWAIGTAYLFTGLVLLQVIWPILPVPTRLDRTATEFAGWRELGQTAENMRRQMPRPADTFLFGLRYQTASELAFYAPGQPRTVSINKWKRPNVYDFWWKDEDLLGRDAIGVTDTSAGQRVRLNQIFERVDPPVKLIVYKRAGFLRRRTTAAPVKVFYLYRAYGFKGGLRWEAPDEFDIRAK